MATYVFEAKGKLILREVKYRLKFTMKYKWLMSNILLKQKLMKGRVEIGKGVEPFTKRGAVRRGEKNMQKKTGQSTEGQPGQDLHFVLILLCPPIHDVWKCPVIFIQNQTENKHLS